jgi:hypothetical protein
MTQISTAERRHHRASVIMRAPSSRSWSRLLPHKKGGVAGKTDGGYQPNTAVAVLELNRGTVGQGDRHSICKFIATDA